MAESLHSQLLNQASRLARLDPRRPQQANLRRSISTAYYALFHLLVDRACRDIVGSAPARKPYRDVLARAFNHSEMVSVCRSFAGGTLPQPMVKRLPRGLQIPAELQRVAAVFVRAQEKRHLADYDPAERLTRSEVIDFVALIESAFADWAQVQAGDEARFFLTCLLTWSRLSSRS